MLFGINLLPRAHVSFLVIHKPVKSAVGSSLTKRNLRRKIAVKQVILIIALLFSSSAVSQELGPITTEQDAKNLADQVLGGISSGNVIPAIDLLAPIFPLPPNERAGLATRITQNRMAIGQRFGKSLGYELVKEEKVMAI